MVDSRELLVPREHGVADKQRGKRHRRLCRTLQTDLLGVVMNVARLPWLTVVSLTVALVLASSCSLAGAPAAGGAPATASSRPTAGTLPATSTVPAAWTTPTGEVPDGSTPFALKTDTPRPSDGPKRYSTRELALKSNNPHPMTLWEGKIIYADVTIETQPINRTTSRIIEHDLATGHEAVLIEAQPPHYSAVPLHRSGDWLFYCEGGTTEPGPIFNPPLDYCAFNLRTGERRHLAMLQGSTCSGPPSGPDLFGTAFGDNGFAYVRANVSNGECREQLRVYNVETGEDRLLLETDSGQTVFQSPMLRGDKVIFGQAWRAEWPPGVVPTPKPDRPGPPARYQVWGDIFSLDLKTGEKVNLTNTGQASSPAIWGDYLMWIDEPARGAQEHGSGEVYVGNLKTGQRKKLTNDASYMHLYSYPLAGDGFFVWRDAHEVKDKLLVYFPESDEMVYLQGPTGGPTVDNGRPDGKNLFWKWSDWSGAGPTVGPYRGIVNRDRVKDRPWRVYMTNFE